MICNILLDLEVVLVADDSSDNTGDDSDSGGFGSDGSGNGDGTDGGGGGGGGGGGHSALYWRREIWFHIVMVLLECLQVFSAMHIYFPSVFWLFSGSFTAVYYNICVYS